MNLNFGAKTTAGHAAVLMVLAATWLEPAHAQEAPTADQVREALEVRRGELKSTLERAGEIEEDVAKLTKEREEINTRLLETAAQIQSSEGKLTQIENRMGELDAKEKLVRGSLEQRHDQIAKLLAALQRMGRNPPPVIVTKREDALEMVRSAMLLASAFPGMRTQALQLADTLSDLMRLMDDIRTEGEKLRTENIRLNDLKTRLAGLMENKRQSITERQDELKSVREAAAEISRNVTDLDDLIAKFGRAVAENTGLEAYDARLRDQEAGLTEVGDADAPAKAALAVTSPQTEPGAATPDGPASGSAATPSRQVVELTPAGSSLMPGSAGRIAPAIPFHLAKAKLPMPVQGRRVLSYGERTQYGSNSKGIVLETRSGAQVTAPCDGWVVYAGDFRSYGKLLIINAGGGYHVLLAGLSQIDVQPGQFVLAAEPVGSMNTSSQEAAGAGSAAPVLYVEFRKGSQPIDPEPWWAVTHQKAQG